MSVLSGVLNKGSIRTVKAKKNIISMFLIKGLNIAVNLAMVPLLIHALNPEKYGVWLTITSILALLHFFDIGFGHGLRNKLAEAIALDDIKLARGYISTAYATIAAFILLCIGVFLLIQNFLDWVLILSAPEVLREEIRLLMVIVIVSFFLTFFFRLITSVMYAFQMPAFANFVILLGQGLSLGVIYVMLQTGVTITLLNAGIALSLSPLAALAGLTFYLFGTKYKKYAPSFKLIDKSLIKSIFTLGIGFFLVQITSIVIFQTNNLVIAHIVGPSAVTDYNIAYKYLGLTAMAFSIITSPFWSATTDAYAKKDINWIKNSVKKLNQIWIIFSVGGLALLASAEFLYNLWLGDSIEIKYEILAPLLIYNIIQMRWYLFGSILNGIGKIRLQLVVTGIEALIHIPLAIFLGNMYGVTGIIISMILMSVTNAIWPVIQYKKLIEGTAEGIWAK